MWDLLSKLNTIQKALYVKVLQDRLILIKDRHQVQVQLIEKSIKQVRNSMNPVIRRLQRLENKHQNSIKIQQYHDTITIVIPQNDTALVNELREFFRYAESRGCRTRKEFVQNNCIIRNLEVTA